MADEVVQAGSNPKRAKALRILALVVLVAAGWRPTMPMWAVTPPR